MFIRFYLVVILFATPLKKLNAFDKLFFLGPKIQLLLKFNTVSILYFDSHIWDKNRPYFDSEIDTKSFKQERNNEHSLGNQSPLIVELKAKNKKLHKTVWLLSVCLSISLFGWLYSLYRHWNKIDTETGEQVANLSVLSIKPERNEIAINTGIAGHVVEEIVEKLAIFENDNHYLESGITLYTLAKNFDTNTQYLSKIINSEKGKTLTAYLRDLRLEYAMSEMKNNPKFRLYTIKAISEECGFNTTESFSKAFKKKFNIYPSQFFKTKKKDSK